MGGGGGGGGRGIFGLQELFFLAHCLCKNFFLDCNPMHEFFCFMHNFLLN